MIRDIPKTHWFFEVTCRKCDRGARNWRADLCQTFRDISFYSARTPSVQALLGEKELKNKENKKNLGKTGED